MALDVWDIHKAQEFKVGALSFGSLSGSATVAADVLAIPVTASYIAKTTGADAEALTLANGVPGQVITIALVVDGGGTGTLTPATKSGFVSIAFADAGDIATLQYVNDTVGWVILGTAGVAAPPAIAIT
jgi:hypothetical protein